MVIKLRINVHTRSESDPCTRQRSFGSAMAEGGKYIAGIINPHYNVNIASQLP